MRRLVVAPLLLVLAGCLAAGDRSGTPAPAAPEAIEVTPLAAPASAQAATADEAQTTAAAADEAPAAEAGPAPDVAVPEAPADAALALARAGADGRACVRRGGEMRRVGAARLIACVTPTGEGLKGCRTGTDCEGACLARSGTCAPYTPLFGCNEVLDDAGRRMTQCID